MADADKRVAKPQVCKQQREIYLDFSEQHDNFRSGKFSGTYSKLAFDNDWAKLAEKLNAAGPPSKTINEWKGNFSDWKQNIKKKMQDIKSHTLGTGGGGPCKKVLTDLEERFLQIFGLIMATGNVATDELGFSAQQQTESKESDPEDDSLDDLPSTPTNGKIRTPHLIKVNANAPFVQLSTTQRAESPMMNSRKRARSVSSTTSSDFKDTIQATEAKKLDCLERIAVATKQISSNLESVAQSAHHIANVLNVITVIYKHVQNVQLDTDCD